MKNDPGNVSISDGPFEIAYRFDQPDLMFGVIRDAKEVFGNHSGSFSRQQNLFITDNLTWAFEQASEMDLVILITETELPKPPTLNMCVGSRNSLERYLEAGLSLLHTWDSTPSLKPVTA